MSGSGPERYGGCASPVHVWPSVAVALPLERAGDGGVRSGLPGYGLLPSPDILVAKLLARGVLFSPDRLLRGNWVQPVRCGGLGCSWVTRGRESGSQRFVASGLGEEGSRKVQAICLQLDGWIMI